MEYWETKNGDKILYKDLSDKHLDNILKWIEKKENLILYYEAFSEWESFCMEEITNKEDIKKFFNYSGLLKEKERRMGCLI